MYLDLARGHGFLSLFVALLVVGLGVAEASPYQVKVTLRGLDALLRLLLEGVQNVDALGKAHRVNGPVGVAVEILDQFHCTTAEAFEQLCGWRIKPNLGKIQGKAEGILRLAWKIW